MTRNGWKTTVTRRISEGIVLEVIEKGFDALGESPKQAIWFYLEREYNFDRKKVPHNLNDFEQALQKIFGMGYNFLDSLFRQYLKEVTGENLSGCTSFADCVKYLYTKGNVDSIEMQVFDEPFPKPSEP